MEAHERRRVRAAAWRAIAGAAWLIGLHGAALAQQGLGASQPTQLAGAPSAPSVAEDAASPPTGGYASTVYSMDDGTTDQSLGRTNGGIFCWFQAYDTRPASPYDVITHIEVAHGLPAAPGQAMPNGTPFQVCVWEDPNDDGDPVDAQLVAMQLANVVGVDTHALQTVPITPTTVRGVFFIGEFMAHSTNKFPASRDLGTAPQGRAFFTGSLVPTGTFDPSQLASPNHMAIVALDNTGGVLDSVFRVRAASTSSMPLVHCVPKQNALGCLPQISATGAPVASSFVGFVVRGQQFRNQKVGLLLYSVSGRAQTPFQGGFLCMNGPTRRTPAQSSGGSTPPTNDCTGAYAIDMCALAHGLYGSNPLPALLVPGTLVQGQWWARDPGFPAPNNSSLSAGLEYQVAP